MKSLEKSDGMFYESKKSGCAGIMMKCFSGMWSMTVYDENDKIKYHATLSRPYTRKHFQRIIDNGGVWCE